MRAIRSGLTGARDGISAANKVVTGAKALDAAMDAANMSGWTQQREVCHRQRAEWTVRYKGTRREKPRTAWARILRTPTREERLGRAQQAHMRTNMVLGAPLEQQRQDQPPRTSESCSPE